MKDKFDRQRLMKKFSQRHTTKYEVVENGKILQFVRDYSFLSNFYPVEIIVDGVVFPSVENAYQAMKFPKSYWDRFVDIMPGKAKRLSKDLFKKIVDNEDYEAEEHYYRFEFKKVEVMRILLEKKFAHKELKDRLIKTGDLVIVEGNTWGDTFWGVDLRKPDPDSEFGFVGKNILGKLLMELREEIKN